MTVPTERQEQITLFAWAKLYEDVYPCLRLMHHIPNGGWRNSREGADLKRQGVSPGIPDIFLPAARSGFHGLYIELKRRKSSGVSRAQKETIEALAGEGYCVAVCRGWEAARDVILDYLGGKAK